MVELFRSLTQDNKKIAQCRTFCKARNMYFFFKGMVLIFVFDDSDPSWHNSTVTSGRNMKMKTALLLRFMIAAVLISIGCMLLLLGYSGGEMCFGMATLFFLPR